MKSEHVEENVTVIGDDGILRSSAKVDFNDYPRFKCSYAKYILNMGEEQLKMTGDKIILRNADLALRDVEKDNVSFQTLKLSEMINKSYLASKVFYSLGLGEDNYCVIYLPNSTEFHVIALGAWMCGAVISPADYSLTAKSMCYQLEEIKPKVIICSDNNKDKVVEAVKTTGLDNQTKIVIVSLIDETEDKNDNIYSYSKLMRTAESLQAVPDETNNIFDPEKVTLLIWSSGTTGRPKAIQLQNKGLHWLINSKSFSHKIHFLQTTCFFHAGGFFIPLTRLTAGAVSNFFPIEALESPNGSRKLFEASDKLKPVFFMGGSHHIMRMANEPKTTSDGLNLNSIMHIVPVGSGVPHDSYEKLKNHFPKLREVTNAYALTEFNNCITMSSTPKYLGYVYKGSEVKIADPETEKPLRPNQVGEIMARFPYVMKGYLNMHVENAKFFGKDGFIHTGDLGRYDENGIIYFEGRIKEIIKYQNIHIHPIEIEEVLQKHPAVKEVGVFGTPSEADQEHVTAAVVKENGAQVTEEDLKDLVKETLENSKQLKGGVIFVDSLPRNPQGKLQRKRLIELKQH